MSTKPSFDKTAIHSVELNLLDGQVDYKYFYVKMSIIFENFTKK